MEGMIPLTIQVPANAPTINKIKIAPAVDLMLLATSSNILWKGTFVKYPIIAATAPPSKRIN